VEAKSASKKGKPSNRKKPSKEQRKKRHFKKVTKLTTDLTKTATQFYLKVLRPDANPRTRRDTFLAFKGTAEDALVQRSETARIIHEHPILPDSVSSHVNEALAAFLHANMHGSVKNLTSSVEQGDGLGLLKRL
jgi:hypothetical protein